MPLTNYTIRCHTPGCPHEAVFKIASRWSDGLIRELKTYALCCEACLPERFREARRKQAACRLAPGETLEPPGVYRLNRGCRDTGLERLPELEQHLSGAG
jgi:hypothetical protein